MPDNRGDEERIRRLREQAEREHKAAMAKKEADFNARRQAEIKAQRRAEEDRQMIERAAREAEARARRNPTPSNQRDAYSARQAAKKASGQGCAVLLIAGLGVAATFVSQVVRAVV